MQHPQKSPEKRRVGKMAAIIAVCALAALALVLLLPVLREAQPTELIPPPEHERETRVLQVRDVGELQSLTVTHSNGEGYRLVSQEGALKLDMSGELMDISELACEEISNALGYISALGVAANDADEAEAHLSDMGLTPPRAVAVLRYTDGSETRLELGGKVYGTTYSYLRLSGDGGVYICDVGMEDALMYTAARLLPVTQPVLESALIDRVTLRFRRGGVIDMAFGTDDEGAAAGRMLAPYDYPMSADAAQSMLNAVCGIRLGTPLTDTVEHDGTEAPLLVIEAHSREGLRGAVGEDGQLSYERLPEASFRFTLEREHGDYYYICRYEGASCLVSRFLYEALVYADADKLATRNPARMDSEPAHISVVTAKGELSAHIERTERVLPNNQIETDAQGNIVYDAHVTINGAEASEAQYDALVERLAGMTVSGTLEKGWSPEGKEPRWTITLSCADGEKRVLAAYPLDAFSDALSLNGQALHYMNNEALAIALGELMP